MSAGSSSNRNNSSACARGGTDGNLSLPRKSRVFDAAMKDTVNCLRKNGVSYANGGRSAGDIHANGKGIHVNTGGKEIIIVEGRGTTDKADGYRRWENFSPRSDNNNQGISILC
jgi:hypothetical protein